LGFGLIQIPPAPSALFNQTIVLEKLLKIADAMVNDENLTDNVENNQIGG